MIRFIENDDGLLKADLFIENFDMLILFCHSYCDFSNRKVEILSFKDNIRHLKDILIKKHIEDFEVSHASDCTRQFINNFN